MYKNKVVGYTTGVFDLFHVGHLNLLRNAKAMCDTLIVGCSTDDVVIKMKSKTPVIPFQERVDILAAIKYTDMVVSQDIDDYQNKYLAWERYKFDILFVGSDWQGSDKWNELEKKLALNDVTVVYIPYTKTTSSTKLNMMLDKRLE